MFTWKEIVEQGNTLTDYIKDIKDEKIIVDLILLLKKTPDQESDSLKQVLLILRQLLQNSSILILKKIPLTINLVDWLIPHAMDLQQKPSFRALCFSNIALLVKGCQHSDESLQTIIHLVLRYFESEYLSLQANPTVIPDFMILHQIHEIVEQLMLVNETAKLQVLGQATSHALVMLQTLQLPSNSDGVVSGGNTTDKYNIDLLKVSSMIIDLYLLPTPAFALSVVIEPLATVQEEVQSIFTFERILEILSRLLSLANTSSFAHDMYATMYQYLLSLLTKIWKALKKTNSLTANQEQDLIGKLFDSYQSVFVSLESYLSTEQENENSEEVIIIESTNLSNDQQLILSCKKLEILLLIISSHFETIEAQVDDSLFCFLATIESAKISLDSTIENLVIGIMSLQNTLKTKMSSLLKASKASTRKLAKEFKTIASDLRKASIHCVTQILSINSSWLQNHLNDQFWTLTTQSLSTPLLLPIAYKHVKESSLINSEVKEQFFVKLRNHLNNACQHIGQYSQASAEDILTAIQSLCQYDALDLFYMRQYNEAKPEEEPKMVLSPLVSKLFSMFTTYPKSITSSTCSESDKKRMIRSWKRHVSLLYQEFFQCITRAYYESSPESIHLFLELLSPTYLLLQLSQGDMYELLNTGKELNQSQTSTTIITQGVNEELEEEDDRVESLHQTFQLLLSILDYFLSAPIQSYLNEHSVPNSMIFSLVTTWKQIIYLCAQQILFPVLFPEDEISLSLQLDIMIKGLQWIFPLMTSENSLYLTTEFVVSCDWFVTIIVSICLAGRKHPARNTSVPTSIQLAEHNSIFDRCIETIRSTPFNNKIDISGDLLYTLFAFIVSKEREEEQDPSKPKHLHEADLSGLNNSSNTVDLSMNIQTLHTLLSIVLTNSEEVPTSIEQLQEYFFGLMESTNSTMSFTLQRYDLLTRVLSTMISLEY